MPVTLKQSHRDVLRRQVITQLTGIGDIYLALDGAQWTTALGMRRRYEDCMRLMDDLGWEENDPAEEYAITIDTIPLMCVLARLHEGAAEVLELHLDLALDEEAADATLTLAICGELLVSLAGDPVRNAMAAYREARDEHRGSARGSS